MKSLCTLIGMERKNVLSLPREVSVASKVLKEGKGNLHKANICEIETLTS